jgi:CO/xanthine dehydrogenase FAD-binding subunit
VPLGEFVMDFMYTTRTPEELVAEILVPKASLSAQASYVRLARVEGSFAIVNVAAVVDGASASIAIGGVAPRPVVVDVSASIARNGSSPEGIAQAAREASAGASGDIFSDGEYRQQMAGVLAVRAVNEALGRSDGDAKDGA